MAKIPTYPSTDFIWKNGVGRTPLTRIQPRDGKFPDQFYIKSARTGAVKLFLHDAETMEANEFFDGEAAAYFSPGGLAKVQIWC